MDGEWAEVPDATATRSRRARAAGGRVVAVGTTDDPRARVGRAPAPAALAAGRAAGPTRSFVPGFRFRVVDALLTNFHLPRSTLLMLVSAVRRPRARARAPTPRRCARGYRFYSYGDAMLIL